MKGVLFDLDGIIADTASYHFLAWQLLMKEEFQLEIPRAIEEKTKGVSREDSLRIILKQLGLSVEKEEFHRLADKKNTLYTQSLEQLTPVAILPGISDLLSRLKEKGIRTALASASKNGPTILEKLGLLPYFDVIIDPATIQRGKPAPDIFLKAAESLQLPVSDCLGIEDAISGITAINQAKIVSIAVGGPELNHANYRVSSTEKLTIELLEEIWKQCHTS